MTKHASKEIFERATSEEMAKKAAADKVAAASKVAAAKKAAAERGGSRGGDRGWFEVVSMFGRPWNTTGGSWGKIGVRGALDAPCYVWSHLLPLFNG